MQDDHIGDFALCNLATSFLDFHFVAADSGVYMCPIFE